VDLGGYRSVTGDPVPGDQVPEPLVAGLFSRLLGVELPGRGSNYLKQQLTFHRLLAPGDEVTATVEITRIRPDRRLVDLTTRCVGADGEPVCSGAALVLAAGVEPAAAVG
jgi:acyl dehydratase